MPTRTNAPAAGDSQSLPDTHACRCLGARPGILNMTVADLAGASLPALWQAFQDADDYHLVNLSEGGDEREELHASAMMDITRRLLIARRGESYADLDAKLALMQRELHYCNVDASNLDAADAWAALASVRRDLVLMPEWDRAMAQVAETKARLDGERKAGDILTRARKLRAQAEALEAEARALEADHG